MFAQSAGKSCLAHAASIKRSRRPRQSTSWASPYDSAAAHGAAAAEVRSADGAVSWLEGFGPATISVCLVSRTEWFEPDGYERHDFSSCPSAGIMILTSDCTTTAYSTGALRCIYWDISLEVGQLYWSRLLERLGLVGGVSFTLCCCTIPELLQTHISTQTVLENHKREGRHCFHHSKETRVVEDNFCLLYAAASMDSTACIW